MLRGINLGAGEPYVAVAARLEAPLVTADAKLAAAVRRPASLVVLLGRPD